MRLFYAGNPNATISVTVAPAADPDGVKGGIAADWVDENGEPRNITTYFKPGGVEVPDDLGRYLLAKKLARKTGLILPRMAA